MTGSDPEPEPEPDRPEPAPGPEAETGRGAGSGLGRDSRPDEGAEPDDGPAGGPEPGDGPPRGSEPGNGSASSPEPEPETEPEPDREAASAGAEAAAGRLPTGPPHPRSATLGQTLKRTAAEFKEDGLTDVAAALTYYAVLSVFPALIALVSLVSLVMSREKIVETLNDLVDTVGPASAAETFKKPIESMASGSGAPSVLLVVGVLGALWTASGYVGAFVRASNVIYEVQEGRPFRTLRPVQLLVTAAAVLLLAVVLVGLVVSGPVAESAGRALGVGHAAVTAWEWAKWPVLVLVVVAIIAGLYYAAPNVRLPGPSSVLPGAVLALGVWLVASGGFAFYAANFGSYNETYGTLGGVVVFLVWLWLTNLAVVLGAEFNAERERGRQLAAGVPGAERRIQLAERSAVVRKKRARTV
ncbi:YihY/virulence factor BrkB family protein [Streptomyces sp. NPDC006992]|uniref:YihY/virulence factor BrkB family protein n=1 Tax=unclassified Streptomyces TaxID=2593676 RepID=UPI0033D954DB